MYQAAHQASTDKNKKNYRLLVVCSQGPITKL